MIFRLPNQGHCGRELALVGSSIPAILQESISEGLTLVNRLILSRNFGVQHETPSHPHLYKKSDSLSAKSL